MCHLFSLETSFFEISANFDIIFSGEAVEILKIGDDIGERGTQELFKYLIGFSVSLAVAETRAVKGAPLFNDFLTYFRPILVNFCPFPILNFSQIWQKGVFYFEITLINI